MTQALTWLFGHPLRLIVVYAVLFGCLALAYPALEAAGFNRIAVGITLFTLLGIEIARVRHNSRLRVERGGSLVDKYVADKARAQEAEKTHSRAIIDHTGLSVSDFEAAKAFYTAALKPLGTQFLITVPPEHTGGTKVGGFGSATSNDMGRAQFWIAEDGPQSPPIHVAFTATNRAQVDAFHVAALNANGTDNGAPGPRPHYHEHYYGAFVRDPDGNNIEAVCHHPPT